VVSEAARVAFDPTTNGRWFFSAIDPATNSSSIAIGNGLTGTETTYTGRALYTGCAGEGGDIIIGESTRYSSDRFSERLVYLQTNDTLVEPSPTIPHWGDVWPDANIAMLPGRAVIFRSAGDGYWNNYVDNSMFYSPDYRGTTEPFLLDGTAAIDVPPMVLADGRVIVARPNGLVELSGFPSAPTVNYTGFCTITDAALQSVAQGTHQLTHARIDSQSQTMIAAWTHRYDGPIYVWDSTSNTEIEVPIGDIRTELPGSWNFVQIVTEV
jgi:hypothetical protein